MRAAEIAKRVGLAVVVFAVVVAGGVTATGGESTETPSIEPLTVAAYSGPDAVAAAPDETGRVEVTANASGDVVLIDASHGSSLDREQLTPLVQALTAQGAEVRFLAGQAGGRSGPGSGSPFNASLREADAFIAIGAEQQYTEGQVTGLETFADAGGRVLVVKDPPRMQAALLLFGPQRSQQSDPMPLSPLLSRFGMSVGNGYLYNMHQYDLNYRNVYASPTTPNNLTAGVDRVVLHESTPVRGPNTLVRTTDRTELSQTREPGRYSVVARSGNVVALGDASILGQEYVRHADNEVFVGNLLTFLVSGDKRPQNAPAPPETEEESPTRPSPGGAPPSTPPV